MKSNIFLILTVVLFVYLPMFYCEIGTELKQRKANLVKKHLKRLKKHEGGIKLVGGRAEFEGKSITYVLIL